MNGMFLANPSKWYCRRTQQWNLCWRHFWQSVRPFPLHGWPARCYRHLPLLDDFYGVRTIRFVASQVNHLALNTVLCSLFGLFLSKDSRSTSFLVPSATLSSLVTCNQKMLPPLSIKYVTRAASSFGLSPFTSILPPSLPPLPKTRAVWALFSAAASALARASCGDRLGEIPAPKRLPSVKKPSPAYPDLWRSSYSSCNLERNL